MAVTHGCKNCPMGCLCMGEILTYPKWYNMAATYFLNIFLKPGNALEIVMNYNGQIIY